VVHGIRAVPEPEVAVAVLIHGGGEGTTFAAPAANDILNAYFTGEQRPNRNDRYGYGDGGAG
jgi:cell division protein FtsI/penicillin-binding protein 2